MCLLWRNLQILTSTERSRLWRERHPGADAEKSRRYRNTPKGQQNEIKKSRKRRTLKMGGSHEEYSESLVIHTYGTICHICNKNIDMNASRRVGYGNWEYGLHIDHLVPISKGGDDCLSNVRPTHAICNIRKGSTF
jgi:5-methylcytosine-specific restriction endonuclease McrA